MDMKQIKELMAAMEKSGTKRLKIKEEKGYELELERGMEVAAPAHRPEPHHHFAPAPPPAHHSHPRPTHDEAPAQEMAGDFIASPMVGTFYSSPSPDDPAYVKVGDTVEEDTIVCIIEAMKVMNEVKAGKKGKITEILVDNADPVEFGSKMFKIQ